MKADEARHAREGAGEIRRALLWNSVGPKNQLVKVNKMVEIRDGDFARLACV